MDRQLPDLHKGKAGHRHPLLDAGDRLHAGKSELYAAVIGRLYPRTPKTRLAGLQTGPFHPCFFYVTAVRYRPA